MPRFSEQNWRLTFASKVAARSTASVSGNSFWVKEQPASNNAMDRNGNSSQVDRMDIQAKTFARLQVPRSVFANLSACFAEGKHSAAKESKAIPNLLTGWLSNLSYHAGSCR